jgi:K(+)-stimulated pyrophosphate-energized sodium pump
MGMKIATKMLEPLTGGTFAASIKSSFSGGTVMGLGVAGLAVLGLTSFFFFHFFMNGTWTSTEDMTQSSRNIGWFSWSRIVLFVCVGGGIYTKAADVELI